MGFEPTRAKPIGLAVQRLNHSATQSLCKKEQKIWEQFVFRILYNLAPIVIMFVWSGVQETCMTTAGPLQKVAIILATVLFSILNFIAFYNWKYFHFN